MYRSDGLTAYSYQEKSYLCAHKADQLFYFILLTTIHVNEVDLDQDRFRYFHPNTLPHHVKLNFKPYISSMDIVKEMIDWIDCNVHEKWSLDTLIRTHIDIDLTFSFSTNTDSVLFALRFL